MELERLGVNANKLNLTFNNISYSVHSGLFSQERKLVLSNVCGEFRQGELTAIVGDGKSNLMDILTGYTTEGFSGYVQVGGRGRNLTSFRSSSAHVMQKDHLQPYLTVEETMRIAVNLKLNLGSFDKQQVINILLEELNLNEDKTVYVKCLDSSQKKRLAIALELMSDPSIAFLETPTSDLDTTTSCQLMALLKSLARENRTIICTIEQPSSKILEMIDHLYVIGRGQCVYAGTPKNLQPYLEKIGLRCPNYHNVADYLLEIIDKDDQDRVQQLVSSSENGKSNKWRFSRGRRQPHDFKRMEIASRLPPSINVASCGSNFFKQIGNLAACNIIRLFRERGFTYLQLGMSILNALVIGILYYGVGQSISNARSEFDLLFVTQTLLILSSFYTTLLTVASDLPILDRRYSDRWHKLYSYYLANRIVDLPVQIITVLIYVFVIYFMTKQPLEFQRLVYFLLSCVFTSLVAQSFGLIVGAGFNFQLANLIGFPAIMSSILLSGLLVNIKDMHHSLRWMCHSSFCKYGFEGIMVAIYGLDKPPRKNYDVPYKFHSARRIVGEFDVSQLSYWSSMGNSLAFYIIFNLIAFFAWYMRIKYRRQRSLN